MKTNVTKSKNKQLKVSPTGPKSMATKPTPTKTLKKGGK